MDIFKSVVIVSTVTLSLGAGALLHAQRRNGGGNDNNGGRNGNNSGGPSAQDPGVRAGGVGAGAPISSLNSDQTLFFENGLARFVQVDSVQGGAPNEPGIGLGPGFNANSCSSCHAQPNVGGTSPSQSQYPFLGPNPQVAIANDYGGTNVIPSFITPDGPVREARFPYVAYSNGRISNTPDGGVHDVFSIAGRQDASGCTMPQPNFEAMQSAGNIIFRIPTPVFGAGLIEAVPDSTIIANMAANASVKQMLGISGHPNTSGNDGTVTRFGWKAQNKSLEIFAGEAYNVEIGVTNELFPNERGNAPAACLYNSTPEDSTNFSLDGTQLPSDTVAFAAFMRFLAPPTPSAAGIPGNPPLTSLQNGQAVFSKVHCDMCHTPTLQTGGSAITSGLTNQTAALYSDLLVHHMGQGLADNVSQGAAGPDEFRTAPLWGLGQRIFFIHDGRATPVNGGLINAIEAHSSRGSEANQVIHLFNNLSPHDQQDLLNFLRSL